MFANRIDAASKLAVRLRAYGGRNPLVLGIPRGAVPMAYAIAEALGGEADVVLVAKLRAPGNVESGIGAVHESGEVYLNPYIANVGEEYLELETAAQLQKLRARRAAYESVRPAVDPRDRIAIVVDDGLATGATMCAALKSVRSAAPRRLICAVPVASGEALKLVSQIADEVVCLKTPSWFGAVSQCYAEFPPSDDREVLSVLAQCAAAARRMHAEV